jgi:hypothetical protein
MRGTEMNGHEMNSHKMNSIEMNCHKRKCGNIKKKLSLNKNFMKILLWYDWS